MPLTFLFVFFGGLLIVVGAMVSSLLGSANSSQSRYNANASIQWMCKAGASDELVEAAHAFLDNNPDPEKTYDMFIKELTFIYGEESGNEHLKTFLIPRHFCKEEDRKSCHKIRQFYKGCYDYWFFHLVLSSMGRLDRCVVADGFKVTNEENAEVEMRYIQCIEKRIQKVHPELRFVLVPDPMYGQWYSPTKGIFYLEQVITPKANRKRMW